MAKEIAFENEGFPTLKGSWPWPLIRSNCIPPCITHRPLPTYMPNFIEIKLFVDGRTSETHFIRSAPKSQPNKMQLETADFVPGATTWQTVWNIHIISHYAHSHDVINRSEQWPQVTCTENLMKFGRVFIDRKTDMLSQYFACIPTISSNVTAICQNYLYCLQSK